MRRLVLLTVVCLVASVLTWNQVSSDTGGQESDPAWADPAARTLRLVGRAADVDEQPNFQSNLDCSRLTYRLAASDGMQTGCFVPAAYGLVDPDSDLVIFNGTDEALPLKPYFAHQILTPWPNTLDTLSMAAANTGGSYVALYKNLIADLQDERDFAGRLDAKQITAPPDLTLADQHGQPLVVNPQTMAFSDNGDWLVVETLAGAFVRINLATLDVTAFASAFGAQGNPALLKSQVAVSEDGRYVAVENAMAASLKVYDLASCTNSTDAQPGSCAAYDYWPYLGGQITDPGTITHVRFVTDGLLGFDAVNNGSANSYELAPAAGISALIDYLALGDSYTSGEGAFDYVAGTDDGSDVCHLSARSYPLLISAQLFSSGHSVACSGARLQDILPGQPAGYRGQVTGGIPRSHRSAGSTAEILADFMPGYLAQADFVSRYQPASLTVSVGGDDIGFGNMIQNCVEPHVSFHLSDGTCYDTYEDRLELKNLIDRTAVKWTTLYRHVQSRSPGTRLYVIGYPQIATDTGNCAFNVHLSKSELEFSEEVVDYLNGAIRGAAESAGVSYIDISQALAGHRLCETAGFNVAVNGLTAGKDGGPFGIKIFGKESYHPNALGQSLIAAAVLRQSHNLQAETIETASTPDNSGQSLLNAPKSGRQINTVIPETGMVDRFTNKGAVVSIRVEGLDEGLPPGGSYQVKLDGAGGLTLGTLTGDQSGALAGTVTLPQGTAPGGHTVDVTGANQAGEPIDITQPIYVANGDGDADGDGIPDTTDSCPGAVNSGQDSDHDGVDDSCDDSASSAGEGTSGNSAGTASNNSTAGETAAASAATNDPPSNPDRPGQEATELSTQAVAAVLGAVSTTNYGVANNAPEEPGKPVSRKIATLSVSQAVSTGQPLPRRVDAAHAMAAYHHNLPLKPPVRPAFTRVVPQPGQPTIWPALRVIDWLLWVAVCVGALLCALTARGTGYLLAKGTSMDTG